MRRDASDGFDDGSRPVPGAALFVSCSRCSALHRPEDGLALHPLCAPCRGDDPTDALSPDRFHVLSEGGVAGAVGETSPGSYVLGYLDGSTFMASYVGRSDSDVNAGLHGWVGAPSRPRHHASSPRAPWDSRSGPLPRRGAPALAPIAVGLDTGYTHFTFCYAPSAIAAFERECRDYHELGGDGLDNRCHPRPPPGSPWACPVHG